ncbi:MAG TPA: hypothetical protein VKE69_03915 [Planctomycetota bacterium]|nr:hypothetical protein [Planctomycetota bacterium]
MGMTLLELTLPVFAVTGSLLATMGNFRGRHADPREAAERAAEQMQASLAATDFQKVFASYDVESANDPCGPGTAPGGYFAVRGLAAPDGVAESQVGEVVFPTVGSALREDVTIPELGMPRDLNGDGTIDSLDHSRDYRILPVLVRVRWKSGDANESVAIPAVLKAHREKPVCYGGSTRGRRPA